MVAEEEPLPSVLRLACLLSLVSNGLKPKSLAALQTELLHGYGYERVAHTLPALQKLGLLKRDEGRSGWPALRKALQLVSDEPPEEQEAGDEPKEMGYVYSGYAPLSVRLLQLMSRPGWAAREEALKGLPGKLFEAAQPAQSARRDAGAPEPPAAPAAAPPRVTLVFFVGGCTYAELAAVRWMGRHESPPRQYVVGTTHLCNGDQLLASLVHSFDNNLKRLD